MSSYSVARSVHGGGQPSGPGTGTETELVVCPRVAEFARPSAGTRGGAGHVAWSDYTCSWVGEAAAADLTSSAGTSSAAGCSCCVATVAPAAGRWRYDELHCLTRRTRASTQDSLASAGGL